jgi:hypothetical protein
MANADSAAIRGSRAQDGRGEPFGMPFTNREVAIIVANELNRHDRGLWFYEVERHIDDKRRFIARNARAPVTRPSTLRAIRYRALLRGWAFWPKVNNADAERSKNARPSVHAACHCSERLSGLRADGVTP